MMFSTKLYCFNELKKLLFETPNFFINKLLVTHHRTTQRINWVFIELVKVVEIQIVLYAFPDVVGGVGFFLQERF